MAVFVPEMYPLFMSAPVSVCVVGRTAGNNDVIMWVVRTMACEVLLLWQFVSSVPMFDVVRRWGL